MEEYYLYILLCGDGSYYTGHTNDLERRLVEHQSGKTCGYTLTRLPLQLVYTELFQNRDSALVAERKIKGWTRRKKEILIRYGWHGFKKLV